MCGFVKLANCKSKPRALKGQLSDGVPPRTPEEVFYNLAKTNVDLCKQGPRALVRSDSVYPHTAEYIVREFRKHVLQQFEVSGGSSSDCVAKLLCTAKGFLQDMCRRLC